MAVGIGGLANIVHSASRDPLLFYPMMVPNGVKPFVTEPWVRGEDGIERAVLLGPNQGGKTYTGAIETTYRLRGDHPWRLTANLDRPVHGWLVCMAKKQSLAAQRVLNKVIPQHLLHPRTEFNDSRGFLNQQIKVKHKSGGYSLLEIKTIGEGAKGSEGSGLSSATLDFIWPDEPFPIAIYNELQARLLVRKGSLYCTMTCVGSPMEWFRKRVEQGMPESHYNTFALEYYNSDSWTYNRFGLHEDSVRHLSAAQMRGIASMYLEAERKQRVGGYWEGVTPDRYIAYNPDTNKGNLSTICSNMHDRQWYVGLGFDHGEKPGSQIAVLIMWSVIPGDIKVYILDCCSNDKSTTPAQDAVVILNMLDRQGIDLLRNITLMVGDVNSAGKSFAGASMNEVLGQALLKEYWNRRGIVINPATNHGVMIDTAMKGAGSVSWGCRVLNTGFLTGDIAINPKAVQVDMSLQRWKGGTTGNDADWKHAIDASRYIIVAAVGDTVPYQRLRR